MKKIFVAMTALMVVLAFAGMSFAIGHVDQDSTVVVDFTSPTSDDIDINDEAAKVEVGSVTKEVVELNLPDFIFDGLPEDKNYELTTIFNAVLLSVTFFEEETIVIDFTAVPENWTGVMIERKIEENVFDYFPKEGDGIVTVENPGVYFYSGMPVGDSEIGVLFVELKEASTSTSGGGCSLGMLSPFALLLAVPMVLLRK